MLLAQRHAAARIDSVRRNAASYSVKLTQVSRPSTSVSTMAHQTSVSSAQDYCKPAHDYSRIPVGHDMPSDYEKDIPNWAAKRRAGVVIHPTSLPGPYGIGELGEHAHHLIDWMSSAGLQVWQILPLVPPDAEYYSPYSGTDSNAGNPLLISIDELVKCGLLDASDRPSAVSVANVDFQAVRTWVAWFQLGWQCSCSAAVPLSHAHVPVTAVKQVVKLGRRLQLSKCLCCGRQQTACWAMATSSSCVTS